MSRKLVKLQPRQTCTSTDFVDIWHNSSIKSASYILAMLMSSRANSPQLLAHDPFFFKAGICYVLSLPHWVQYFRNLLTQGSLCVPARPDEPRILRTILQALG